MKPLDFPLLSDENIAPDASTDFARVGAIYGQRGTNNSLVDRTSTFSNAQPVRVVW